MNNVNRTLYIPLYGKAYVSKRNIILNDEMAENIWDKEGFQLKGKSKSKWLAYYMGMRSAVFDKWINNKLDEDDKSIVIHIGCGLDSRVERVTANDSEWYDLDFPEVIEERKKYYHETEKYHMIASDVCELSWIDLLPVDKDVVLVMEGVSMYLNDVQLKNLFTSINQHFNSVKILMDCYSERASKLSEKRNPINDVGVTKTYGYDNPELIVKGSGFKFIKEHDMTPCKYINQLNGIEKIVFKKLYAGTFAKSLYKLYEFESE